MHMHARKGRAEAARGVLGKAAKRAGHPNTEQYQAYEALSTHAAGLGNQQHCYY